MNAVRFGLIVVTAMVCSSTTANAMSLDEAMDRLKGYKFGQEDEAINTIRDTAVGSFNDSTTRQKLLAGLTAILEADATNDAKHFACRQLALIGTEQQVPALAKLLIDPELSQIARYALARIPGEAVDRALIDALGRTEGANRLGIINTLGNRRSEAAIEPLLPLLESDEKDIAAEAAKALGRIGTDALARVFRRALDVPSSADPEIVADATLTCADLLLANRSGAGYFPADVLYAQVSSSGLPDHVRGAALRGYALTSPYKAADTVISALQADDGQLQAIAAQIIRDILGPSKIGRELLKVLPDLPERSQALAIYAMAGWRHNAVATAVAKACDSEAAVVRTAALEVLGRVGDASSIPVLLKAATTGAENECAVARDSLVSLPGDDIDKTLVSRLDSADDKEKEQIIGVLTRRDTTEAVPMLLEAAGSRSPEVRRAAIDGLTELADAEHLPALASLVNGQDRQTRRMFVAVARRCGAQRQASELLVSKKGGSRDAQLRSSLLLTLGELGDDAGLGTLRKALTDEDESVRRASIVALSGWPNATPMDDLLRVARSAYDRAHQTLALRGYVDLAGRGDSLTSDERLVCYETALGLAENPAEKRRVLAALSGIKSVGALQLAASYLGDEPVAQEAALAAVTIARDIYAANAGPAKTVLTRVAAAGVRQDIKDQASTIIGEIEAAKSYLVEWEVAGPYSEKGKNYAQLFDTVFDPERPKAKVQWRKMPVSKNGQHPAYLDLLKELDGGEQRVAYLRTQIEATETRPVVLEIFSDDGVKAWLNGQVVHSNNVARPIMPEPDRVTVTLQKGVNRLMLKVTQNNQPWGAIVRVREAKTAEARLGEGFRLHVINADSRFEAAGVLDVNRDGRLDIFCGGFWYEAPDWKPHFVREVQEQGNYYYDFANLPVDVDGDGWTDIVNAAWHNKMVFWKRNPGRAGGPWEVFEIDTPGNMETAMAFDIDGDGQTDILPNIMSQAAWYEFHRDVSAPQGVRWEKHQLPKEAAGHGLGAGDVNKDGRCDVVTPKGWLEQTADGWQWHPEFELGHASIPILVHDVDADGDSDIIWGLGHNYGLFWLEQTNVNGQREWQKHLIDDSWSQPHYMLMADLDNDGKDELVTGKRYYAHNGKDPGGNDPLCVYYYNFDTAAKKWTRHTMHEGGRVGLGINTAAVDMDGDGDIDVVAPGKSGLYLFENLVK